MFNITIRIVIYVIIGIILIGIAYHDYLIDSAKEKRLLELEAKIKRYEDNKK